MEGSTAASAERSSSDEEASRVQGTADSRKKDKKYNISEKNDSESHRMGAKSKSKSSGETSSRTKHSTVSTRRRQHSRSPPSRHHRERYSRHNSRSPKRKRRSASPRRKHRSRSPAERHSRFARESRSKEQKPVSKHQPTVEPTGAQSTSDNVTVPNDQLGKEKHEQPETGKPLTAEQQLEMALGAAQALVPKLPAYMNPGAMNPLKYQSVKEKRKLLWSHNKESPSSKSFNNWEQVKLGEEEGSQSKFRRLMGIRSKPPQEGSPESTISPDTASKLEQQYEVSRYLTHIARGAGLGYGAQSAAPVTDYKEKLEDQ